METSRSELTQVPPLKASQIRVGTRLTQTASFVPQGLFGVLYWYFLYPFHRLIFTDMINAIGRLAVGSPSAKRELQSLDEPA